MTTRTEPRRLFARMSLAAYSAVLGVAVCGGLLASSVAQANTPSPYATVAVCPGGCSWWGMFAEQDKAQFTQVIQKGVVIVESQKENKL